LFGQSWSFEEKKILAPEDDVEFILSNPLEEVLLVACPGSSIMMRCQRADSRSPNGKIGSRRRH